MQAESVRGDGFTSAGHIYDELEQFPTDIGDTGISGCDPAGVKIDESCPRRLRSLRLETLMTGASANPYGVPRPVVNT